MKIITGKFSGNRAAIFAVALMATLSMSASAQQADLVMRSARSLPEFSPFTKTEQQTILGVTELLERYVEAYSGKGDSRAYAALWAFPNGGFAANNVLLPGMSSPEAVANGVAQHFAHRTSPLKTVSSEITVHPINDIAAIGQVRYNFQDTPNSTQRSFTSVYLCVKTKDGWRFYVAMDGKDSGTSFLNVATSHREWNF
ncbi:nuclear transport factor 2 family protein [Sphingobium sp. Cam5-1]|uniref:nuclear transport factor 2 family protein n=1 Tax=Sphingobium sp. Cam5-1 TaxID=2789327 RepID=UPI0018AD2D9D|nr:nuclear transport factor 2 family protein [Sphingobium sp. Cam5-1]QPI72252.1 nuclear transport factor 2 family protein [Sphingobium sp. Cam5-1]